MIIFIKKLETILYCYTNNLFNCHIHQTMMDHINSGKRIDMNQLMIDHANSITRQT